MQTLHSAAQSGLSPSLMPMPYARAICLPLAVLPLVPCCLQEVDETRKELLERTRSGVDISLWERLGRIQVLVFDVSGNKGEHSSLTQTSAASRS